MATFNDLDFIFLLKKNLLIFERLNLVYICCILSVDIAIGYELFICVICIDGLI